MNFKYEFLLAFLCAWVHLGSGVELTVTCNIISNNYCFIDKRIELQLNDTLKFIADDAKTIEALDIVQDSKLVALPSGIFQNFPALEKLVVTDLGISILLADRFEGADKLNVLHIHINNITIVPSKVFVNLPNVKELLLSHSSVEIIEDDAFDGMINLEELRLEHNLLKSIRRSAFTGAPKIKSLNLRSNKIERIEEGALNLPNLEELDLRLNQLTTLSDNLLVEAVNLYVVFFDQNKITHIGKAFNDCNKLGILCLNFNPVEDVELAALAALKNLKSLHLENIGLKLPVEIPSPTPNGSKLKEIWLAGNDLSNPDIFKHLSVFGKLENIFLQDNKFTTFNDVNKIRKYFPEIKRLSLLDNKPSPCDWIRNNEEFFENISVSSDGCKSADFDGTMWRN